MRVRVNRFADRVEFGNELNWRISEDPTVEGYTLYRNGELIATLSKKTNNYLDRGVRRNQRYDYTIYSFNSSGLKSIPVSIDL